MDLLKRSSPIFPGFSAKEMVLVNPFLRFTKTTDLLLKSPVLRARVLKRLLISGTVERLSRGFGEGCTFSTEWEKKAGLSKAPKTSHSLRRPIPWMPPDRGPGSQKGGFQKGWFWRIFPRNENRNEGTFACSPGTKTRTRLHSPTPPFYETALLSPLDLREFQPSGSYPRHRQNKTGTKVKVTQFVIRRSEEYKR